MSLLESWKVLVANRLLAEAKVAVLAAGLTRIKLCPALTSTSRIYRRPRLIKRPTSTSERCLER